MDYTSIHVYGHLLSDDILHSIETDRSLEGNREADFKLDTPLQETIDYAWTALRAGWGFYLTRSNVNDPYGTRRSREFMEDFLHKFGYHPQRQQANVTTETGSSHAISFLCPDAGQMPVIVKGDRTADTEADRLERCSLDYRSKGNRREKSAHATMLEYLNNTENIYGIIANGPTLRLIRNSGQLVKLTYIEFDLRRMFEEDKYAEFCLMFRLLHSSRFKSEGDAPTIIEKYFNLSIESGNRIRDGLSQAAQKAMEIIGQATLKQTGEGNDALRKAFSEGRINALKYNKELIHLLYRLLFLFIIEDRNLVYDGETPEKTRWREIYKKYYAASRFRSLSELPYARDSRYDDMWQGLMETFRLFEDESFGSKIGIKPLGGVLFDKDTLRWLKNCSISNDAMFDAFHALNVFRDENGQSVKINYSSLDVEEFGSVYEGILELRPIVTVGSQTSSWRFGYVGGLDRKSTSSYYTRPDLVQALIRSTLEPVIKERIARYLTPEEKVGSLLKMKVCDPASGSGHFILAMARTLAWYISSIRSGEDNPASMEYRNALREVIQKCVYAVDYNPDAVELCKLVLWIEGYCADKPLSFLDHHVRCGNSVVGVANLNILLDGVPDKALSAVDKDTLKLAKEVNKKALKDAVAIKYAKGRGLSLSLFEEGYQMGYVGDEQVSLAKQVQEINALPENTLLEELTKKHKWEELMESPSVESLRRACDIFVDAFYHDITEEDIICADGLRMPDFPYTSTVYQALEEIKQLDNPDPNYVPLTPEFCQYIDREARKYRFFHWAVEFPEVFAEGDGFDVICGNPPWDKLQMEDEKWFLGKDNDIVDAPNQAARDKKIKALQDSNPELYEEYVEARNAIASQSNFVKNSGRFTLTNCGKIELSSLFAELCLQFSKEAWGLVLPTGIAVNDSNKAFFSKLVDENRLISLYDFENREALFDIHRMFKFSLLTAGKAQPKPRSVQGGFYLTRLDHLLDPNRIYTLQTSDFSLLNPNTKTCPTFRTSRDAELTRKFYRNAPILVNDETGSNPWGIRFATLFNMATDSPLFKTNEQLIELGASKDGNFFHLNGIRYVPLYEGKMVWLHNHQFGEFPSFGKRPSSISQTPLNKLSDNNSTLSPWYWVPEDEVICQMTKSDKDGNVIWHWPYHFYTAFRDVTNATNERTCVASLVPGGVYAAGDNLPLIFNEREIVPGLCPVAVMASIPFDYIARQKVGGSHMNMFILKQMPFPSPDKISEKIKWEMAKRVIELTYFNHDMDAWVEELWEEMTNEQRNEMPNVGQKEPFIFDPDRRAVLQAELDAIVAHLYGLTTDELRYILDPEDICGPGCINETFRVLKERELREYGEYRTRRLVLDAFRTLPFLNNH